MWETAYARLSCHLHPTPWGPPGLQSHAGNVKFTGSPHVQGQNRKRWWLTLKYGLSRGLMVCVSKRPSSRKIHGVPVGGSSSLKNLKMAVRASSAWSTEAQLLDRRMGERGTAAQSRQSWTRKGCKAQEEGVWGGWKLMTFPCQRVASAAPLSGEGWSSNPCLLYTQMHRACRFYTPR